MHEIDKQTLRRVYFAICNGDIVRLTKFSLGSVIFKFDLKDKELYDFAELLNNINIDVYTVVEYLINNKIMFKIKFRYLTFISFKRNMKLFFIVQSIKRTLAVKRLKLKLINVIIFGKKFEKKFINGKERNSLLLDVTIPKKNLILFTQMDSNFVWPKINRLDKKDKAIGVSLMIFFIQFGYVRFKEGL